MSGARSPRSVRVPAFLVHGVRVGSAEMIEHKPVDRDGIEIVMRAEASDELRRFNPSAPRACEVSVTVSMRAMLTDKQALVLGRKMATDRLIKRMEETYGGLNAEPEPTPLQSAPQRLTRPRRMLA